MTGIAETAISHRQPICGIIHEASKISTVEPVAQNTWNMETRGDEL